MKPRLLSHRLPIVVWILMMIQKYLMVRAVAAAFSSRTSPRIRLARAGFCSHTRNPSTALEQLSPVAQHVQSVIQTEILPAIHSSSLQKQQCELRDVTWIVGVSGGCDSVALLAVLLELQVENLQVVHFDHEQRGAASDADRRLVEDWCARVRIPCKTFYWSNEKPRNFSQETARHWRRARMRQVWLEASASNNEASTGLLVTAHHKDDSEETLLLKVLRGTHLTHLKGLDMVAHDDRHADLFWVRPLLHLRKAALEAYVQEGSYEWRQDASNASPKYLRNRVRNELVPLLQDLVGGTHVLERRLGALVQQSNELEQDLSGRVETYLQDRLVDKGRQFLLTSDQEDKSGITLDWLGQQALYKWIVTQSPTVSNSHDNTKQNNPATISQDVWKRVVGQLEGYPDRREWRINLGGGLDLVRTGVALSLESAWESEKENGQREVSWHVLETDEPLSDHDLVLSLPRVWVDEWTEKSTHGTRMFLSTASESSHLTITPPWRKGRTPVRVLEFLRGQKVPLHQRGTARLLYLPGMDGGVLLAVHVPTTCKWIVDAAFDLVSGDTGSDHVLVGVSNGI